LGAGCGNYQAVYHDSICAWEPQFDIHTEIAMGVCTNRFQDWDCSNPGLVDANNYCDLAEYFYGIDPCDPNALGDGCPLPMAGLLPVTDADCIAIHETTHYNEWRDFFFGLEAYCKTQGWLDPIPIDCNDPMTISCRSAAPLFESRIDRGLTAYMTAKAEDIGKATSGEYRARRAAEWCFHLAGGDVCECARHNGWYNENPCAICPP
jgi:hypothetical protein